RLDARRAHWTPTGWELMDGAAREIARDGKVTTIPFSHTAVELEETIRDFTDIQKPPTAMSYRELRDYVARLETAGFQVKKYLVDMYSKLSDPLKNLIMVLVAIPFALQSPRGGRLYGIALAIGLMAASRAVPPAGVGADTAVGTGRPPKIRASDCSSVASIAIWLP